MPSRHLASEHPLKQRAQLDPIAPDDRERVRVNARLALTYAAAPAEV